MAKQKYYVVWSGIKPGVYPTWTECEAQVKGVKGARFKSFQTESEAHDAYERGAPASSLQEKKLSAQPSCCIRKKVAGLENPPDWRNDTVLPLPPDVTANAWAVDAACSGNPGPMEYRGVDLATGATVFHYGPVHGTNNIGEFLAIVHALALMKRENIRKVVYTDSRTALLWVKAWACRTRLRRDSRTEPLYQLIARAEAWLHNNQWDDTPILKWQTEKWGEIPADFGRKQHGK